MRYLTDDIKKDLTSKTVFLSGPRQCGKTTLAKSLMDKNSVYLNWDIRNDKKIIREASWPKESNLVILDEIHKFPKWKNFLKGIIDETGNKPPLLVTGSARLETFRHAGDPLTGRYFHYRLHPIDVSESKLFLPQLSAEARLKRLLQTGGFPESYLKPQDAERLRNNRFDLVIREDLRDLSRSSSLNAIEILLELLRERVGTTISYSNLAEDLSVSSPTVKSWIELLERLYLIFIVKPYSGKLSRSIKKEPKVFFYDCSSAYDGKNLGARIENAVASSLLKFCQWSYDKIGTKFELFFFKDREKREVDFVVTKNKKPHWLIEVKLSDAELSRSLNYLHERLKPVESFQLVLNLDKPRDQNGIKIRSAAEWLDKLTLF